MEDPADRKRFEEVEARLAAKRSSGPPYKETYALIREEIWALQADLVDRYRNFHDHDWRREISHLFEQCGVGLHGEIEREKRLRREAEIAQRIAEEKAQGKKG